MVSVSAPRYKNIPSTMLHAAWHSTFSLKTWLVLLLDCKLLKGTRQCHVYLYVPRTC